MAKRYKGKYVALVEMDFDIDASIFGNMPFDEVRKKVREEITPSLKKILKERLRKNGTVRVTQQYTDLYEAEEDGTH